VRPLADREEAEVPRDGGIAVHLSEPAADLSLAR
jgi:hypothetical protein